MGKYYGRSTKTTNKSEAKKEAVKLYQDIILNSRQTGITSKTKSFGIIGKQFIESLKTTARKDTFRNDNSKFTNDLLPFFGDKDVSLINYSDITKFLEKIGERGISTATKKHFLVVIRKILKFAVANGVMNNIPAFPQIRGNLPTSQRRDYLTYKEYYNFAKAIADHIDSGAEPWTYRHLQVTMEMKYLVQFMVNSFIRPSDIRVLKHIHVKEQIDSKTKEKWLTLTHPATKTTASEVQTMPLCVKIYNNLVAWQKEHGIYDPKGYVFMPQYKNRTTAMGLLGKLFALAVEKTRLEEETGKNVTLYSLRHTAIMLRLILGDQIDTVSLARNARTSAAMIDKFYASHLTSLDVRKKLHSFAKEPVTSNTKNKK
jgi:integrase